jgi:hypothetical protein
MKLFFRPLIILSLFILVLSGTHAYAATYYVDNTVTDTNIASSAPDCLDYSFSTFSCGAGADTVFATIADINTLILSPSDTVLLRRGQSFREQLTVPSSGTLNNPITFGAFGSGNKPALIGSKLMDDTWTLASGTIYKISLASTTVVLNDETFLDENNGGFASLALGEWDLESGELFVNIGTDPTGGSIEASQRSYSVYLYEQDYITLEDMIFRNGNDAGLYVRSETEHNVGIILNNVETYGSGNDGFKQVTSGIYTNSVTYNNVIARFHGDDGLSLHSGGIATVNTGIFSDNVSGINNVSRSQIAMNDVIFENNDFAIRIFGAPMDAPMDINTLNGATFSDNGLNISFGGSHSLEADDVTISGGTTGVELDLDSTGDYTLSNIVLSNTTEEAFRLKGTARVEIDNASVSGGTHNIFDMDAPGTVDISDIEISNTIGRAIYITGSAPTSITNAKIHNTTNHAIEITSGGSLSLNYALVYEILGGKTAVIIRAGAGAVIRNSTFVDNSRGVLFYDAIELYNNIFVGHDIGIWNGAGGTLLTLSNNLLFENTTDFSGGAGVNTNGLSADPLFVDRDNNDYSLQAGSPAIDAGLDLGTLYENGLLPASVWPNNIIIDSQNNNMLWEIGAYLSDANPPIDPIIDPVLSGDTTITGTGEVGTTITLSGITCAPASVIVDAGGAWICSAIIPTPVLGDTITATSTDAAGNFSTGTYDIPTPAVDPPVSVSRSASAKRILNIFQDDPSPTNADLISRLKEQINALQEQLKQSLCSITSSRLIKLGMIGEDVRQVQLCMNSLGYTTGATDGIYGTNTYKAIIEYQTAKGLTFIDGIVGSETLKIMNGN